MHSFSTTSEFSSPRTHTSQVRSHVELSHLRDLRRVKTSSYDRDSIRVYYLSPTRTVLKMVCWFLKEESILKFPSISKVS